MPVYVYRCECGEEREHLSAGFLSIRETEDIFCKCGKEMERVVPNFHWKFGGVTGRTDIELRTTDMMDSVNKFKNKSKMRS